MRIGIDLDNTIAGYDKVFGTVAREMGLIAIDFEGGKREIRDALRRDDNEEAWRRLQGKVYGKFMPQAELMEGVDRFFKTCRDQKETVFIISHKTQFGHGDPAGINLHDVARKWMATHRFFDPDGFAIPTENVYFEPTRPAKISRIEALDCTHFIDDLEEVLLDDGFPAGVGRFLFGSNAIPQPDVPFKTFNDWGAIREELFDA